jgi:hypothetical protein
MRTTAFIILLLLTIIHLVMFTGCVPKVITNTITESKTTTIKERDTTFIYKGASVGAGVNLDSIIKVLEMQFKQGLNGVETKRSFVDPQTKVKLSFWMDKYGRLQADCSSKDSTWAAKLQDVVTNYEKQTHQTEVIKEKYIPTWTKILIGVLFIIAAITSAMVFWFITQAAK